MLLDPKVRSVILTLTAAYNALAEEAERAARNAAESSHQLPENSGDLADATQLIDIRSAQNRSATVAAGCNGKCDQIQANLASLWQFGSVSCNSCRNHIETERLTVLPETGTCASCAKTAATDKKRSNRARSK